MTVHTPLSRRRFLWSSGAVVVGFSFSDTATALGEQAVTRVTTLAGARTPPASGKSLDPKRADSFLALHPDGRVTVYTSKVDVGTGLRVALSQMVAEELGVPLDHVQVVDGDTALTPDHGGTGGSTGVPRGGVEIRQAAATVREWLLAQAATRLGQPAPGLTIIAGEVRPSAGGHGVSIGALVAGAPMELPVDPAAPLRNPSNYRVVGTAAPRPDVPGKCTGTHGFLHDFSLPGMLHARVLRPAAVGATLVSVDEGSVRDIPGVRVMRQEHLLAVVAADEWAAVKAARALRATWSEWQGLPGSTGLDAFVRASPIARDETLVDRGDAPGALAAAAAPGVLEATYVWPFQSHASLGPSCAVADATPEMATVWTSTQQPHGLRTNLAAIFGYAPERLRLVYMDGSGSYGTNGADDAAADALWLSKALGKPVRVQWSREDELAWDPKGPPQVLTLRGALGPDASIAGWTTEMWLPANVAGPRPILAADAAGLAQARGRSAGQIAQNGDPPYVAPHLRVVVHWLKETPLRQSNLRAPGKIANVFAVESFTDELAAAARVDPLDFRRRKLSDARALAVLTRAAEMIGWQARPSPNPRAAQGDWAVGRGVAYARYKHAENYVAMAMEVAVERATGVIRPRRITCAHDCGLVINPDGLRNQIEGSIVQTLGRALHEEVTFDRSRVTSVNWASYPILRFVEAPVVEVALIDRPELPPLGAGEASTAPVAAALANAVYDATGVRLRTVPFTAARVKAALGQGTAEGP